ncbi:MAG TPA: bifunctional precorrin-2 dehydrogenase/sirohydrochlorin ferrochelatase [Blastocatellia bacterium]|nr:bifunctional precorrin-2 dehydrogenase/sirohydrochlorin ferrochelatase [Blastocatellia bacterium]
MRYYPVCLDLQNRPVLVVGGGTIAEGKITQLVAASAQVHVVSPALTDKLQAMVTQGAISHRRGEFIEADLDGKVLVISATDQQAVNEAVAQAASTRGILCNVVDQPALCNFITPSLVSRGDLQISISTSGKSPTVAQRVKREISALIGAEYETLLEITAELRAEVRTLIPTFDERRDFLKSFVESAALDLIRAGKVEDAKQLAQQILADYRSENLREEITG